MEQFQKAITKTMFYFLLTGTCLFLAINPVKTAIVLDSLSHWQTPRSANHAFDAREKNTTVESCLQMCEELFDIWPETVIFADTTEYATQQSDYFSQQQGHLRPMCFFLPKDETQVTQAIILAERLSCVFAVKSGGHATFEGASNTRIGLTMNLERLDQVAVSSDGNLVSVGPGNRWHTVYSELEKDNLTVTGGRTGSVGVGGLTLGGGISFYSGHRGFVCDNVANYQVVLADGSTVDANVDTHPDLYWALRGGGANFGVVTRFDFYTLSQEMMWGGIRNYTIEQVEGVLDAYVDFGYRAPENPSAYQITTIYYTNDQNHATVDLYNVDPEPSPSIFDSLQKIPSLSDTTAIQWQSKISWTNYEGQPDGYRQTYWTATYKLDRKLARLVDQVFREETRFLGDLDGLEARCIMQVITTDMLRHMKANGGNALGIEDIDYPLMLLNPAFRWENPADDLRILQANMNLVNRLNALAREMRLDEPFLYMNYASQFQDVIMSYGTKNVERLRAVARKYDPTGVFQRLQPGYFKLSGRVG